MRESFSILWKIVTGQIKKEEMQREIQSEYDKSTISQLPPSIKNSHRLDYLELNSKYMSKYGHYFQVTEKNNHDKRRTI